MIPKSTKLVVRKAASSLRVVLSLVKSLHPVLLTARQNRLLTSRSNKLKKEL